MKTFLLFFAVVFLNYGACRDFYVGMFKNNDILVASDRLTKPRVPHRLQYAKYGRHFKCKITYFRVIDRLGYGPGPKVLIVRGGLQRNYVVLRLSAYNSPISVNIYVGCENKMKPTTKQIVTTTRSRSNSTTADGNNTNDGTADEEAGSENGTAAADGGEAAAGADGSEDTTTTEETTTTTTTTEAPAEEEAEE